MATLTLGLDIYRGDDAPTTPAGVDFVKMKAAGAKFVIIKSSQADFRDTHYIRHWTAAGDAGLLRGAYHFLTWNKPIRDQVAVCLDLITKYPPDIPLCADFEWWTGITTAADIRYRLQVFLELVQHETGRVPMIYTGPNFWNVNGSQDPYWLKYPLWIANYGVSQPYVPKPWTLPTFWQFTDSGDGHRYGTESRECDLNYFYGDLAKLQQFASYTPPTTPPTTPPEGPAAVQFRVVTDGNLNVRSAPNASAPIVGTLAPGTVVTPINYAGANCWAEIAPGRWSCVSNSSGSLMEKVVA